MATDTADPREAARARERQIEDGVFLGGDDFPPMGGTSDTDADPDNADPDLEAAPSVDEDSEAEDNEPTGFEWPEDVQVPERLKGKSAAEIAKEFASLQTEFGRQSTELGDIRATMRDLVQEQLIQSRASEPEPKAKEISYEDFEADPVTAVKTVVQSALKEALEPVQKQSEQAKVQAQLAELNSEYPGYMKTVQSPEFAAWVQASPYRQKVYQQAQGWDFDAARELLSGYAESRPASDDPVEEKTRQQVRQKATIKGGSGAVKVKGKPFKYTAAQMAQMYIHDREQYNALYPEFEKAWNEGRVK